MSVTPPESPALPPVAALRDALARCLTRDRHRLGQRLRELDLLRDAAQRAPKHAALADAVARSQAAVAARAARLPVLTYPDLPVAARASDIIAAIRDHQVVVIAGETGSGKTTQLPKLALAAGRGVHGLIGHTQPRRIAARAVATRIAEEIGSPVGELVGFKVRFTDESSPDGFIKLMTDGVLLAELAQDRYLSAYDTLIIDEAHERSLNIDFLLGVLKQILPKRPDLKVIITSATIDVERFSRHFRDAQGRDAPVISVEGRTYPVEVLYRPIAEAGAASDEDECFDAIEEAIPRAVLAAVEECLQLERQKGRAGQGDILVFSSHEREIREIADLLRKYGPPHTEILPLYARLSVSEQQKVFQKGRGRRIVIATNVAETSLTVPNIHYVIDPGFARISRYSWRSKVQRLPIEAVAQASANQRKGRCGRVAPGVCIRLYSEADFLGRTEFTEPEIRRTNLAAVILQMAALRLGEIDSFPFLDAPDSRLISDGLRLLEELGAVDGEARLTDIGRTLSRFPVDPRIARMLLEARSRGALREVLIIAAALGSQDPRDRPHDRQQAADERHAQFRHPESDFLWYVKLWDTLEAQRGELSENQRREFARRHFLSWLRLREWRETHRQLLQLCRDIGWDVSTKAGEAEAPVRASQEKGKSASVSRTAPPPGTLAAGAEREKGMTASNAGSEPAPDSLNYEAVHRSLLAGLLSRIAQKQEDREYLAARGQKAFVFPGSVLAKKGPPWIMAAELVETARVYARTVARIEPEWAEAIAGDLLKRRHFEPHWEKRQGRVMAYEQVTLYGLILVAKRKLAYEGINPAEAREIFIRSALVEGDADLRAPFFTHNRELIEDVRVLEDKVRRRDILVDEEALFAFYDERIPAEVTGLKAFEGWRRDIERQDPKHLFLTRDYLLARADADTAAADDDFPDHIELNGTRFALEYRFEPGHPADGVSLLVPVGLLDEVDEARLGWLVPGLLGEKVEALLKGLPKPLRRLLVPVPDTARALLAEIGDGQGSLLARLSEVLRRRGLTVGPADWDEAGLPAHCRFHIKVLGEKQQLLAEGRDLTALRRQCREQGGAALPQAAGRLEQTGLTDWPAEDIPESVALTVKGMQSRAYPALVEAGSTVDLRLFPTRREAEAAHARGLNALYRLRLAAEFRQAGRRVAGHKALLLHYAPHGRAEALEAMFVTALSDSVFVAGRPLVYTRGAFDQCLSQFRPGLLAEAERLLTLVVQVYEGFAGVQRQLEAFRAPVFARAVADIRGQLAALHPADFLARVPVARWQHYPRYLKALALRLDKLPNNVVRDDAASAELAQRWQALQARQAALAARDIVAPALEDYRWLLEEYRVALFAQTVKTAVPVSATRLDKLWQALPA